MSGLTPWDMQGRVSTAERGWSNAVEQANANAHTANLAIDAMEVWRKRALIAEADEAGRTAQRDLLRELIPVYGERALDVYTADSYEKSDKLSTWQKPMTVAQYVYVKAFDKYLSKTDLSKPYHQYRNI